MCVQIDVYPKSVSPTATLYASQKQAYQFAVEQQPQSNAQLCDVLECTFFIGDNEALMHLSSRLKKCAHSQMTKVTELSAWLVSQRKSWRNLFCGILPPRTFPL